MARQLIEAIRKGNEAEARTILQNEQYGCIDCQTSRRDGTALFWACAKGYTELVQILVRKGANVNARTSYNSTPLIAAADRNRHQVMRLLLQHGADVDSQTTNGDTACHLAAYRGHVEAVRVLVEAGADLDLTNNRFRTPLDDAMRQGHEGVVPYLDTATLLFDAGSQSANTRGPKKASFNDFKKTDAILDLTSSRYHYDTSSHQRRQSTDRLSSSDGLSRTSSYEDCEVNGMDFTDRIRGRDLDGREFYFPDTDGPISSTFSSSHPFSPSHPFSSPALSLTFTSSNISSTTTDLSSATTDFTFGDSNDLSLTSSRRSSNKNCLMALNIPA